MQGITYIDLFTALSASRLHPGVSSPFSVGQIFVESQLNVGSAFSFTVPRNFDSASLRSPRKMLSMCNNEPSVFWFTTTALRLWQAQVQVRRVVAQCGVDTSPKEVVMGVKLLGESEVVVRHLWEYVVFCALHALAHASFIVIVQTLFQSRDSVENLIRKLEEEKAKVSALKLRLESAESNTPHSLSRPSTELNLKQTLMAINDPVEASSGIVGVLCHSDLFNGEIEILSVDDVPSNQLVVENIVSTNMTNTKVCLPCFEVVV